jgi:hypothetical protein
MNAQHIEHAIDVGYAVSHSDIARRIDKCEYAAGVHAFLATLLKGANWWQGPVIRAVMGLVTQYRRGRQCEP